MEQPQRHNSPFFHEERHAILTEHLNKAITICGAGALGGNLTETLARMGFQKIKLIDKDRVELRNLSTQPYSRAETGIFKARALANMLYRSIQARIEPVEKELTRANAASLLQNSMLIIDAFDNTASRAAVSELARTVNTPCLHIGFSTDGLYGSGQWEPGYQVPQEEVEDPCDYPLTRPLALMISSLAARVVSDYFRTGEMLNFELTWHDSKISYW